MDNEDLGVAVPIAEMAHIVGWGEGSPRGRSKLPLDKRQSVENLILSCRNCHRPVDDKGVIGKFDVETLRKLKRDHEETMRFLTGTTGNPRALLVRVGGSVRGRAPQVSRSTVLSALLREGLFPASIPGSFYGDLDVDLTDHADPMTPADFRACSQGIAILAAKVNDAVRSGGIQRVAVFGFARIPLLIELGARLGDKVEAVIFQRQRSDGEDAWRWPTNSGAPCEFEVRVVREGDRDKVALLVSVSGTVEPDALPSDCDTYTVYEIVPRAPAEPQIDLITSRDSLARFEGTARAFLALLERKHGKLDTVALFPAVPVSAAVALGRVLAAGSTPAWRVFDRDDSRKFRDALEVRP